MILNWKEVGDVYTTQDELKAHVDHCVKEALKAERKAAIKTVMGIITIPIPTRKLIAEKLKERDK